MSKARESSNETNRLKGLRTFIKSKSKKSSIKNEIIDDLIKTGYYKHIYNIWINSDYDLNDTYLNGDYKDNDIEGLMIKDIDILFEMEFCEPHELKDKYDGLYIYEVPIEGF